MENFSETLLDWFDKNKRDLPWRRSRDPYQIWLSEIILQQTRVEQGLPYYDEFIRHFPSVFDLASASEDEVLKRWQGLGYYSRAKNLHHTAKKIVGDFNGRFPETHKDLLNLKGVGDYTAAAIASIAFGEAVPVLDGNVFRLIARFFGIEADIMKSSSRALFKAVLEAEIDPQRAGDFNQALMEFGSLQCVPSKPDCHSCTLNQACYAFTNQAQDKLPVKRKATKLKKRFFNYLVLTDSQEILLSKRTKKDIWQGLYEFPLIESNKLLDFEEFAQATIEKGFLKADDFVLVDEVSLPKHQLSHQQIFSRFFIVYCKHLSSEMESSPIARLHEYPVSRLIDKFLENEPDFISKKS